jgi:hypothetical protein
MLREEARYREGVLAVAGHAEVEGLDALEEEPCVVRRQAGAQVAQRDGPEAQGEGDLAELGREVDGPAQAVVVLVGLGEERELGIGPVEAARVRDDAAYRGAVAAEPFREGVDDHVRAVLYGLEEIGRGEGRVHDEGQLVLLRDARNSVEVGHVQGRVADGLDVEEPRLGADGLLEALGIPDVGEGRPYAEVGKDGVEHRVGAAVEVRGRDDLVAGAGDGDDRVEDGGRARGHGDRGGPALELGDAGLEDLVGRVAEAGVDVAEFLEGEEVGRVPGVLEGEGARAVDRHGARECGRVGIVAGLDRGGLEGALFLVGHMVPPEGSKGRPPISARLVGSCPLPSPARRRAP